MEVTPWSGARIVSAPGQQDVAENGKRSFAAFGLSQSVTVTKNLTLDATLDSSRTLGGVDSAELINPAQPAASGGTINDSGSFGEDFTALTFGGTWRASKWSATGRGEWRDGQFANRRGVIFGTIRQLGEGTMVGTGLTWTRANFDSFEGQDLASNTLIGGLDLRYGLGDHFEVGGTGSVRHNLTDLTTDFSYGPQIGLSPSKDVLLLGYNFSGYRDADFSAARSTDEGVFASVKLKLDAQSFGFLGLGQ